MGNSLCGPRPVDGFFDYIYGQVGGLLARAYAGDPENRFSLILSHYLLPQGDVFA